MEKSMIEQYKEQMLNMYRTVNRVPQPESVPQPAPTPEEPIDSSGKLVAIVTTLRTLYPVPRARVTVFRGEPNNMQVLLTGYTDQSGRTEEFVLETPSKSESQSPNGSLIPYARYNMMVEAEGYISNIHLNIPVFSGVTSLQRSNMMLLETAGEDKSPQVFDEAEQYDL